MATIQTINIGNIVNDGLGDDLRTAFQKVNSNFSELNSALIVTASNLGNTGESVFKQKTGTNLEFKRLVAGNKITLTSSADSILIASTVETSFQRITTTDGYIDADTYQNITVQGDDNITVTADNNVISITSTFDLASILSTVDFGPLNGNYSSMIQMNTALINMDFGTFTNPSNVNYDDELSGPAPGQSGA